METTSAVACPTCGAAVQADAMFCSECGAALGPRCASCHRGIPPHARFCPHCGAPNVATASTRAPAQALSAQEIPHGERRHASVLFSDLSGYTALNRAFDPEEVARVLNRLKAGATRIVEAHDGTVNQFVGDEVMALFGVPRAHDDDPLRAVRAAIEWRDHVREIGNQLAPQLGTALRVHTGVNTGLMITQLRDRRDGLYGVTGDAVNTAARLADAAESDEILIGPETHRAIRSVFETESIGELRLRGRDEPLVAHRVLRAAAAIGVASTRIGEFVGRRAEMQILSRCFDDVRAGHGRLVGISGEPGIGKSRFCDQFSLGLPADALVLRGQCRSFGSVAPYEPFREVLRAALLSAGDEGPEAERVIARVEGELPACAEHLAILLELLSLRSEAHPIPAAAVARPQIAILAALQAVLAALAPARPVVLVLSDWHWADPASEQALYHLAEGVASRRLMLIVNYRSYYQPHWGPAALRIDLPPLGADDTRPIVHRIVGADAPEALVRRIFERTSGNPLFVEEVANALVDFGSAGGADAERMVESVVPDNVAAVLRARIDRLPSPCIELLKLASVLGESFALPLLRDVCDPSSDFDDRVGDLVSAGLLHEPVDGETVRFKHAIVRDVAYEMLLLQRRRELHGAVGCAIEQRDGDRIHEHVERLAHHFARSDDRNKAVIYLVRAGDKAVASGAMIQALGQYVEAVRILGEMPETPEQMRSRVDLTLRLSHSAVYRPSKALRELLHSSLELSERLGDPRAASYSLYWMGFLEHSLGCWAASRDYFERCTAQAEERGDARLLSMSHANLGQTLFHTGDYPEAMRLLEDSVRLSRSISEKAAGRFISYPLGYQAMIHADTGRFDLADKELEEAGALSRGVGLLYVEAAVAGTRGVVELFRGDWVACRKSATELERKSKRIGSTFMQSVSQTLGGYARCFDGQRSEGLAMLRRGVDMLERSEISMMLSFLHACLAEALVLGDETDEAQAFAERALEHAMTREDRMGEPQACRVLMLVTGRRSPGDRDRIDAALAAAVAAARRRGSVRDEVITMMRAAELLAERDPDWARDRLKECAERFRALQMPWYGARSEELLAGVARG